MPNSMLAATSVIKRCVYNIGDHEGRFELYWTMEG